ncbi:hypothetical protein GCM10010913_36540 [Paenibacillus aceti]|uniref:Uncharacterized protein n=1 Tax=Paenibacillus aceti TaxID=1820010 RepID=A0ABQ1W348_9BACL|nr:hypothetical protein GCM10010913_36540 [Paenibacillus aceti]
MHFVQLKSPFPHEPRKTVILTVLIAIKVMLEPTCEILAVFYTIRNFGEWSNLSGQSDVASG